MTVQLTIEAHYTLILLDVILIQRQQFVQLFSAYWLFLAVGWLMPNFAAVMAPHSLWLVHELVALTLSSPLLSMCTLSFLEIELLLHLLTLVHPILLQWKVRQLCQALVFLWYERLDMLLDAVRSIWAKSKLIILAHFFLNMTHWTVEWSLLAKPIVIEWTILLSSIADWRLMSIDAFLALLTMTFLHEVATDRHFLFLVDVEIFAIVTSLALTFEPVDADNLLVLGFVCFEIMRLVDSN